MRKFLKSNKAATAIEFGIIAPVFFLLLVGIIEIGLTMFYDSSLNTGIRSVARKGVPEGFTSNAQMIEIMENHLGGLYDTGKATLIVVPFNSFESPDFVQARKDFVASPKAFFDARAGFTTLPPLRDAENAQSGNIMLYGVRYEWGGITKLMSPFIPADLYAFSIVRNEEF